MGRADDELVMQIGNKGYFAPDDIESYPKNLDLCEVAMKRLPLVSRWRASAI